MLLQSTKESRAKVQSQLNASQAFLLKDELAIVTGGGTGLGFAMASCLIAAGARVVITGRRKEVLHQAVDSLGSHAIGMQHDVTSSADSDEFISNLTKEHGTPSILINNAGVHVKKSVEDHSIEDFRNVMATHVEGAFSMTRAVVPFMKTSGKGSIIFITSMSAILGIPEVIAYSAAKSAYLGMVRGLASELGSANIRVNAISPGWIQSPMLEKALSGDPARRNKILSRTPQSRFGYPEDIGWAAVFLCSPAAAFINGAVLPVDGGASIGF